MNGIDLLLTASGLLDAQSSEAGASAPILSSRKRSRECGDDSDGQGDDSLDSPPPRKRRRRTRSSSSSSKQPSRRSSPSSLSGSRSPKRAKVLQFSSLSELLRVKPLLGYESPFVRDSVDIEYEGLSDGLIAPKAPLVSFAAFAQNQKQIEVENCGPPPESSVASPSQKGPSSSSHRKSKSKGKSKRRKSRARRRKRSKSRAQSSEDDEDEENVDEEEEEEDDEDDDDEPSTARRKKKKKKKRPSSSSSSRRKHRRHHRHGDRKKSHHNRRRRHSHSHPNPTKSTESVVTPSRPPSPTPESDISFLSAWTEDDMARKLLATRTISVYPPPPSQPLQAQSASASTPFRLVIRQCTACGRDRTPSWRTGPVGPRTLCDTCGILWRSGALRLDAQTGGSAVAGGKGFSPEKILREFTSAEMLRFRLVESSQPDELVPVAEVVPAADIPADADGDADGDELSLSDETSKSESTESDKEPVPVPSPPPKDSEQTIPSELVPLKSRPKSPSPQSSEPVLSRLQIPRFVVGSSRESSKRTKQQDDV